MGTATISSWKTAMGAAADAVRAIGLFPGICALLFAIYVFQGAVSERLERPGTTETEILGISVLLLVSFVAIVALTIPLLRTYAGGTTDLTPRLVLRMLGWMAALLVAAIVCVALVFGILAAITLTFGDVHTISVTHWSVVLLLIPAAWLAFRLTTLWPALALDEAAPLLRRSFRETKGYVWHFLLTGICSLVVFVPLMIVSGLVAYLVVGTFYVAGTPQQLSLGAELTIGAFNGAIGLFSVLYACALYGRFFRTVRGLG